MISDLYPEESNKLDVVGHLEELRKRIIIVLFVLALTTALAFIRCDIILKYAISSSRGSISDLVFIGPTEAFVSYFKTSLLAGFIFSFPVILMQVFAYVAPAFKKRTRRRLIVWLIAALVLFYSGLFFSYFIAIPAALDFLINFGKDIFTPMITVGKFVSFFSALLLVGGLIFEIPVGMAICSDLGLIDSGELKEKRHIAVLVIMILAAVITPTQDIFNMLLFAIPMILLFEIGVLLAHFIEKKRK